MDIQNLYTHFLQHPVICTDSRNLQPGAIFWGLRGDHFDGGAFAGQALDQGCSLAVAHADWMDHRPGLVCVPDPLETLQALARLHRQNLGIPVLGITGTNGKTTTKELVTAVLSTTFNVHATSGNLNNHIGVPLTLLGMNQETNMAVVEMGANHPGEIAALCKIAQPTFGLITSIGKAHLEGFGSIEGVLKTKTELYQWIREKGEAIFVHSGNTLLAGPASGLKAILYGCEPTANIQGEVIQANPFLRIRWKRNSGHWNEVSTHLVGDYNLVNVLAAAAVGTFFGVEDTVVNGALEEYLPKNNRSQFVKTQRNTLILDAYNANPTSMEFAIRSFGNLQEAKKAMILGDMLELGQEAESEHLHIFEFCHQYPDAEIYFVGPVFYSLLKGKYPMVFPDKHSLQEFLNQKPIHGYTILLKASRGIGLEAILPIL